MYDWRSDLHFVGKLLIKKGDGFISKGNDTIVKVDKKDLSLKEKMHMVSLSDQKYVLNYGKSLYIVTWISKLG